MNAAPHDTRTSAEIGRRARLDLRFAVRCGRTVLAQAYAEPPFRVARCFDAGNGGVHLILASSAPGIFAGDRLQQSIVLEPGARVRLTSQSSLQVHPGRAEDDARLESRYAIAAGASLECEWHPTIPFTGSRLAQRIAIAVAGDGCLRWSDATMSGREAGGERWQFARFAHELRLIREQQLQYLERYVIEPAVQAPSQRWAAGAAAYFGTMLALGHGHDRRAADALQARLEGSCGALTETAVDLLEGDLLLLRSTSASGVAFHAARAAAAALW